MDDVAAKLEYPQWRCFRVRDEICGGDGVSERKARGILRRALKTGAAQDDELKREVSADDEHARRIGSEFEAH